jgi:hypothetical protein
LFSTESSDEEQPLESKCDMTSHGEEREMYSNFLLSSQVKGKDQGGCDCILKHDHNTIESCKPTPLRPYREPIRIDYQGSYQRGGWISDLRFQEGIQQNSYRALQKSLFGTPYIPNIELGSNLVHGFYRSKPTSLKGTTPFLTTQQWAKKLETPATIDHVDKDCHGDEHDTFISKSNAKGSTINHIVLAPEMDVDAIGTINKVEKKEFKTLEKKLPSPTIVPSAAKVVAGIGSLSNIPTASFNLNVNSEDWPPLPSSHVVCCPKNTRMYSLTSYQCEVNSKPLNKINFDKGGGHQIGLESKAEGSIVTTIPPRRGLVDETKTKSIAASLQKGIMIGSVSVPLSDYMRPSRPRLGDAARRINIYLPEHQSYTAVLAVPPVQYTRDPMASTIGRQKAYNGINNLEFKDSSNMQVMDSYECPDYHRTSSTRSSTCINLNVRHVRGPLYPLGDQGERGILSKHPSWSGGLVRHLPLKVWRPVRSTSENADPNPGSGTNIENSPTNALEKVTTEHVGREENVDAMLSRTEGTQVWEMDIDRVEECLDFANNPKTQDGDQNFILNVKAKKDNAPLNVTNYDESLVSLKNEHLKNHEETNQVASLAKVDSSNACQLLKNNATQLNANYTFHDKKDNTKEIDDVVHVETTPSHSAWITEAIEFHLNSKFI